MKVRVEFLLETRPCKQFAFFLREAEFQSGSRRIKGQVHFFGEFSCFKFRFHSKSDKAAGLRALRL